MKDKKIKALALLSGGLDSSLAAKLILDQGIEVIGISFTSPFFSRNRPGKAFSKTAAEKFGIPFKTFDLGMEYLKIIKDPAHGHGSAINPCIDCKILMLKNAKKIAGEIGADFIITGEVLNQRPMSQHYQALKTIEKEAGLEGKLLRPLSAKHLPEIDPETKGLVNREKLLNLKGRERKIQLALAKKFGINEYSSPAGGCLLTQKEFTNKLRFLLKNKKRITLDDVALLKIGRHFAILKSRIIVGKNEMENKEILSRKQKSDYIFEVPDYGSPITLLQGTKNKKAITTAVRLTAKYSDCKKEKVLVKYGKNKPLKKIIVEPSTQEEADGLNLTR